MWNNTDERRIPTSESLNADTNGGRNEISFNQTQQLLGVYPFASATPSTHVARHLSNLTISAVPPSYIRPSYYYTPANYGETPMRYVETAQLLAASIPQKGAERMFWDRTRSDLVQLLGDQTAANYYPFSPSQRNLLSAPSSYQTSPFSQSLMHHIAPYNAYPTPPPATLAFSSSSSSLANALGSPPSEREKYYERNPTKTHHNSTESTAFFDSFLDDRVAELPRSQQPRNTLEINSSPPATPKNIQSSPDPLRIGSLSSSPLTPFTASQITPRKRKFVEVVIETPSKRPSSPKLSNVPSSVPRTPQTSTSSMRPKAEITPSHNPTMQVYVEVAPPPRSWSVSTGAAIQNYIPSLDLGGYASDDDDDYMRRRDAENGTRSTGRKTGDRDDRAPFEKFLNLLEDIFEAEDNISVDGDLATLPPTIFSQFSLDPARPNLHHSMIAKLTKTISKIARPTKRVRLASVQWEGNLPGTPRRTGGMAEVENQTLVRVLKVLERSVRAGEDLDPFGFLVKRGGTTGEKIISSPSKAGKTKAGKKMLDAVDDEIKRPNSPAESQRAQEDVQMGLDGEIVDLTEEDLVKLERTFEIARDSIMAADCCIALLTSDRLAKQLYSEELITSCLDTIKNQLTRIVYPFIEAPSSDAREYSPALMYVTNRMTRSSSLLDSARHRHLIGETFQTLSAVLPRINNLPLDLFFVVESGNESEAKVKKDAASSLISITLGSSGMRGLRLEALSLIRSIFANHEDQRSWIIEEILSSLIKLSDSKQKAGQFRLRDGRSIRTVSALLLQLVQTSAHNIRKEVRHIAKARQQLFALRRHESMGGDSEGPYLDEKDLEEVKLYSTGLEAPTKAAKAIVLFLTQRSGKGKSTKNVNEQEYRAIFDNLISDLLVVLFWPEWPAASLMLNIICRYMISSLDDVKSSNNDNNASKAMALDHLGVIAGRLRANMLKWGKISSEEYPGSDSPLQTIDEIIPTASKRRLERLINVHQEVLAHLSKRSSEDQAYESARELSAVIWGQELANALIQLDAIMTAAAEEFPNPGDSKSKLAAFGEKIKIALRDAWKDAPTDVFDNATQDEILRIDSLAEQIGITQSLRNAFDPILNIIIVALDAPPVFVRTKALRALSQILTVDSSVLSIPNVRHAIESHLLDSSPQVRDAAVELIGKYMIDSPVVAGDYYQKISERIADTGLGVRKRVIRLLKTFYMVTDGLNRRIDICSKLVLRMFDEDDTVKDLAIKTLEEVWFTSAPPPGNKSRGPNDSSVLARRNHLLATVSVIMGVCGNFRDRQSPLEDMLNKIVSSKEGEDISAFHAHLVELCDTMIDGLVDASDFMNFTVINCIRTIHLFTIAYPSLISGTKASTLLPYLKNPTNPEEHITSDYILKIYRASIPHMPKTSAKFGNDLQQLLQPMVLKPNAQAGLGSLQTTVACLCVVVQHLTRDFGPIVEHIYDCILRLYEKYTDNSIRGRLLVCLGSLFRAQPTLMTLESSATMMDAIFASSEEEKLTKNKVTALSASVNMEELVGNTHGFAESGVSSAVVQRYLVQIIDAALSPLSQIQTPAVDILSYTIKQGLAHPLLSFPVIVALETSPVSALSTRAVALHTILHHKHASLLNSGFVPACHKSYEYQCQIIGTEGGKVEVYGFRMQPTPMALLARWYALVREKRAMRQEFLRAVLKVFELREVGETKEDTVRFVRYMAENFASFDYRTQEEVLTVVKTLTRELAETGALLVERIAPDNLLAQLRSQGQNQGTQESVVNAESTQGPQVKKGTVLFVRREMPEICAGKKEWSGGSASDTEEGRCDLVGTDAIHYEVNFDRRRYGDSKNKGFQFLEIWNEDGAAAEPEDDVWE
ncbi:hypothetical protein EW145_g7376 [Phellinidium pouzarii]|uniref:Sister chromatid cohesion protein n=1 Tax=Phellinidium pouzarii TaxID=167371 RepID=A0A4S4KKY8_9AGAM|nr:hypothetical protein EW145_g7376 [Phellinidium pouzarii]